MNSMSDFEPRVARWMLAGMTVLLLVAAGPIAARAADPEFVGVLAVALEDDVATKIGLSAETKARLEEFVAQRTDAATEIALKIKDLPPAEQFDRLEPFRRESEQQGLALLTKSQRDKLEEIRLQRAGQAASAANKSSAPPATSESPAAGKITAATEPVAKSSDKPQAVEKKDGLLRFNCHYQPWREVLEWFAEQADLSLIGDATVPGTFNYKDDRKYTPAQAIDLMNGVLLTKGFILIRRERALMLVNLADGVPPNLVPFVPVDQLDQCGNFELASTLFTVQKLSPGDAAGEIQKLLGPQGSVVPLPNLGQLKVTETGGQLRVIRSLLQNLDNPEGTRAERFETITIDHAFPPDALNTIRLLLNIPEGKNSTPDNSLRIMPEIGTRKLLLSGRPDAIARVKDILRVVDVPSGNSGNAALETPQLYTYRINMADPTTAYQVIQTLLADQPGARLTMDPTTKTLIALAKPSQDATIQATLAQLQQSGGRQFEAFRLRVIDPAQAVPAIKKLFAAEGEGAPIVEAEPSTRQVMVRGSEGQIAQVRALLVKMGEPLSDGATSGETAQKGNVRMIPLSGHQAESVIEQLQAVWPTMRQNKIRIVTPTSNIPTIRTHEDDPQPEAPGTGIIIQPKSSEVAPPAKRTEKSEPVLPADARTQRPGGVRFMLAAQQTDKPVEPEKTEPSKPAGDAAPIIITVGPGGIMIASSDTEALDQLEGLIAAMSSRTMAGSQRYTVVYLKYANATAVAQLLSSIFSGGGAGGSGGGLASNLASAALGDVGGGLVTGILGLDNGGGAPAAARVTATGTIAVVPDDRLNALFIQANPADLDTIEQLLKVIDQPHSPEDVQVIARPRLIPVFNSSAQSVADVVKQVYGDRINLPAGQQAQPTPADFMQLLTGGRRGGGGGGRGGRGGPGGNNQRPDAEIQKMSIGVDTRSNSLVVTASEPLFQEVKALVEQLDQPEAGDSTQSMKVITLHRSNPASIQRALTAIAGENAQTTAVQSSTANRQGQGQGQGGPFVPGGNVDQIRRQADLFNMMQGGRRFGGGFGQGGGFNGGGGGGGQGQGGGGRFGQGGGFGGPGGGGQGQGGGGGNRFGGGQGQGGGR